MQKKKILGLALIGLLFCAGCTEEINTNSNSILSIHELYADAAILSETVAAKDSWNISTNGSTWCTLHGQPVPNAAKDSVAVTLDIAQNDTGETRIAYVVVSYNIQSNSMIEIGMTTIEVIQKPEFEPEE
ncbi:MAG: hypothetical protein LBK18_09270 [Prevotellaceae bacterium]|jgi:hypothetical protein|nr:hypothetical protein [Prevotellaceae bacterium]